MNKWDPFRNLLSVQEMVNRLFEDTLVPGSRGEQTSAGMWSPPVDICETDKEFVVNAEVPEIKRSDIDIRIQGHTLVIAGERKPQRTQMEVCHRLERSYGTFQRSFLLPGAVDQDGITATLMDGILRIVLPKRGEPVKKQIWITEA